MLIRILLLIGSVIIPTIFIFLGLLFPDVLVAILRIYFVLGCLIHID